MVHIKGKQVIGLDLETTGVDFSSDKPAAPLTLGYAWENDAGQIESEHIKLNVFDPKIHTISAVAMDINKIDINDHFTTANNYNDFAVDLYIYKRLKANLNATEGSLIPTGWNVYGFDMGFMKRFFPLTAQLFRYSSPAELNTLTHALDIAFDFLNAEKNSKDIHKARAKEEILQSHPKFADSMQAHDAEYDALESLICYKNMTAQLEQLKEIGLQITK